MESFVRSLGTLCLLVSFAVAEKARFVQLEVERHFVQRPAAKLTDLEGPSTWETGLLNAHIGYFTHIGIGTPPQRVPVHIDTGSADTWVPAVEACLQQVGTQNVCLMNAFKPNESSSYVESGKDQFSTEYADGTKSQGDYFVDNVEIAGALVTTQSMGLGRKTSIAYGIAGLGYHHMVALMQAVGETYDNLPLRMWRQGLINTVAYSLWMGHIGAEKGSLVFGAIDASKFAGPLKKVPVLKNKHGAYDFFAIPLTGIRAAGPQSSLHINRQDSPIRTILDTGSTLSYLPFDVVQDIWRDVGAIWLRQYGAPMIDCRKRDSSDEMRFQFGGPDGPMIIVPIAEMVLTPGLMPGGQTMIGTEGKWEGRELCQFGIRNHTTLNILGDTFLRSAYVVHDLVNHEVGLAQARLDVSPETPQAVIPFPSYGARIPDMEQPYRY